MRLLPVLSPMLVAFGYPIAGFLVLLIFVIYQLVSGKLLTVFWRVWVVRRERPRMYWTILVIEATVVLLCLYIGTL